MKNKEQQSTNKIPHFASALTFMIRGDSATRQYDTYVNKDEVTFRMLLQGGRRKTLT